jgi:hypothetical protein
LVKQRYATFLTKMRLDIIGCSTVRAMASIHLPGPFIIVMKREKTVTPL